MFKLKRATSIHPVASRKRRNEDHLVTSLIYPTLKKVVDSISIIPDPGKGCTNGSNSQQSEVFSSYLVIQDEIKIGDACGRPPAVDAMIQINDGEDCKVLIPVEAKVEIEQKHLFQIAAYVTKVSTAKDLKENVTIGIIIDKEVFYLVFSPYSVKLDESVPLPITYISPSIVWKDASPQLFSIIPAALLVIACTCYFQLERIERNKQDVDSQILDVARELFKNKHEIKPILDADKITFDDLLQVSKQQQKEIKSLKDKLGLLECLDSIINLLGLEIGGDELVLFGCGKGQPSYASTCSPQHCTEESFHSITGTLQNDVPTDSQSSSTSVGDSI